MTIITRSAIRFWRGEEPPPELHSIVNGKVVTWEEHLATRRKRQAMILERKREYDPWRAVVIHVAFYDMSLMGGWQAMLYGIGQRMWIDRDARQYKETLMKLFPVRSLFEVRWEDWKPAFAKAYKSGMQDGQPVGRGYLWKQRNELMNLNSRSGSKSWKR